MLSWTRHRARRLRALALALVLMAAAPAAAHATVIAAAGDIACDPTDASFNNGLGTATACRQKWTSDLLLSGVDDVLTLGDNQYNSATYSNFLASYDLSWGRVFAKTFPGIGNHEGTTSTSGVGYCKYFGAKAHCNSSGNEGGAAFYSTDIGGWHVVALNSNCAAAGGCDVGSPQYAWLQNDLAAHPATCTLAFWHHPRFSTGHDGSNTFMQPIWKLLYDNGGDLVLSGHSHDYERFAPIDGNGNVNPTDGMREFVVGTGGAFFTGFGTTLAPGSEVRNNKTFGVLKLTLRASGYDWRFVPESGSFTDSGSQNCRGATVPPDTQPPTAPAGLSASAASSSQVDLSWTASSDDLGIAGYEIWRGPQGGTLARIATTTGTGTTYSDTTVTGGQSYDYQVVAKDAAGNPSPPSNTAPVTVPAGGGGQTLTFTPVADATVKQASPTTNFATSSLGSDSGTGVAIESYLRFNVTGVGAATIKSAKLRLFVPSDGTSDGPGIYGCTALQCGSWTETGLTWNTRPARALTATADVAAIPAGTRPEWDVTPLIAGDGNVTLVVGPTPTTDGAFFSSREATTIANRPQLVITT